MANIKSAKKRIRRNDRREAVNHARISRVRTFIKKVEQAIGSGSRADAEAAFRAAQPEMMRGAGKGVMHPNQVSRRLSRLQARIKAL